MNGRHTNSRTDKKGSVALNADVCVTESTSVSPLAFRSQSEKPATSAQGGSYFCMKLWRTSPPSARGHGKADLARTDGKIVRNTRRYILALQGRVSENQNLTKLNSWQEGAVCRNVHPQDPWLLTSKLQ